jgi:hypothetical protein
MVDLAPAAVIAPRVPTMKYEKTWFALGFLIIYLEKSGTLSAALGTLNGLWYVSDGSPVAKTDRAAVVLRARMDWALQRTACATARDTAAVGSGPMAVSERVCVAQLGGGAIGGIGGLLDGATGKSKTKCTESFFLDRACNSRC